MPEAVSYRLELTLFDRVTLRTGFFSGELFRNSLSDETPFICVNEHTLCVWGEGEGGGGGGE